MCGAEGWCGAALCGPSAAANGRQLPPSGHRVLALVCQHVTVKGRLLGGAVRAVGAGVRFLARVAPNVSLEDALVGGAVVAVGAREGPVPRVCVDVLLHQSLP